MQRGLATHALPEDLRLAHDSGVTFAINYGGHTPPTPHAPALTPPYPP
jgi:hypothetical protein